MFRSSHYIWRYLSRGLYAAGLICSGASLAWSQSVEVKREGNTVKIDGPITPQVAQDFLRIVKSDTRILEINSGGGDSASAIKIGYEVYRRHMSIHVTHACLASCAQYIMVAGTTANFDPNALAAFQNSASSISKMLGSKGSVDLRRRYAEEAKSESDFYQHIGISRELLYRPQLELRTTCFAIGPITHGKDQDVLWKSIYKSWTPSLAYLIASGVRIKGFWPQTGEEYKSAFNRVFAVGAPIMLFGGDPAILSQQEINRRMSKIGLCGSDSNP